MAILAGVLGLVTPLAAGALEVVSENTVSGFKFPESVACDRAQQVLYVSQFGSELKPTQKDGAGYISKLSLDGQVLEEKLLPLPGGVLNKPKGVWVQGDHLWTTDIDSAWVFNLTTMKGAQVALPGIQFANDPAVVGNTLYVTDNRGDALYAVTPADFLGIGREPEVKVVWSGRSVNPNGVYPARDGSVLLVGFKSGEEPRGIYSMGSDMATPALSDNIGRLDGVYEMDDGTLLVTDWNSGSLFAWSKAGGMQTLASDFKGPADFCAMPNAGGLLVAVPDLVKSELRIIQLRP